MPRVVAFIQHPDGDFVVPVGMDLIRVVVFDPAEIERRLRAYGTELSEHDAASCREGRSVLIEQKNGIVILFTQSASRQLVGTPARRWSA